MTLTLSRQALENPGIAPDVRRKCLRPLYKACADHGLLPRSLQIELVDGMTGDALYRGGFGDVRKCEHQGQQVAVKVLRIYASDDMRKTTRVSHRWFLVSVRMLTAIYVEVLQGVRSVEGSPASERFAFVGGGDVGESVRNGVEVDAKRQYK